MINYKDFNNKLKNIINEGVAENMIIVDGVVGVGKSSLMEILSEELGLTMFKEPVVDNPLLPLFYENMERYAFPLQVFFLNNRFKMIKEAQKINGAIMDRAPYGDVIFAKMLGEQGNMTKEELDCYLDLFANMMEHLPTPKLLIYLKTNVDSAIKKIRKRGREFEQETPRQYWEDLNKEYEDYFSSYSISPILEIDVSNIDFVNNEEHKKCVVGLIKSELMKIDLNNLLRESRG
jgi:deoxyadenosine/deoxycytidine kinase